jgi:hypothetical protein
MPTECQVEFSIRQIDNKTEAIDVHVLGHGGHGPVIPAHRGSAGLWVVHAGFTISWLVVWNMNFIFPNSWDDDPI